MRLFLDTKTRLFYLFKILCMTTISTPKNPQNDRVYSPATSKKNIAAGWLLCTRTTFTKSVMVSVGVSKLAPFLRYGDLLTENCEFSLAHSHLKPSLGVSPFELLDEFFILKTRVLGLPVGEDFVILACAVFSQCQRVTDRQTDRQTDRHSDDG